MSAEARANGWRGLGGIGQKAPGGWEYICDGVPTPMGCGESITTTRRIARVGAKKSGWLVCYGLKDDGEPDLAVVLTFCPRCAAVVTAQSERRGLGDG